MACLQLDDNGEIVTNSKASIEYSGFPEEYGSGGDHLSDDNSKMVRNSKCTCSILGFSGDPGGQTFKISK